jgi:hypothetical protein
MTPEFRPTKHGTYCSARDPPVRQRCSPLIATIASRLDTLPGDWQCRHDQLSRSLQQPNRLSARTFLP